jgi:hypothetical protein
MGKHSLPQFPATCDIYRNSIANMAALGIKAFQPYTALGAALTDVECEVIGHPGLEGPPVYNTAVMEFYSTLSIIMYFPKGTDIRGLTNLVSGFDTIVTSDGWKFCVVDTYPIAHGFENEFLACVVVPYSP